MIRSVRSLSLASARRRSRMLSAMPVAKTVSSAMIVIAEDQVGGGADARLDLGPGGGDAGADVVDEDAGAHDPAPVLQPVDIGDHRRGLAGAGLGPLKFVVAPARPGDADQFVGDGHAVDIAQPGPVAADQPGLARGHQVGAVVVEDEEIPVLAIEHRGQDARDLELGPFVIRGGAAVDVDEGRAGDGQVVLQFLALGLDQLALQRGDLAVGQLARLAGHDQRNHRDRDQQRHRGQQKELLPVAEPQPGPDRLCASFMAIRLGHIRTAA